MFRNRVICQMECQTKHFLQFFWVSNMRSLERGQDKIKTICDQLRHKTLEPAQKEAAEIIEKAHKLADEIQNSAQQDREKLLQQVRSEIEQERNVFHISLQQAAKQALEGLRQQIEQQLFSKELQHSLESILVNPKVIADLIAGLIAAIEKDGIGTDFSAVIPNLISSEQVNALLLENIRKKLQDHPLEIGNFQGGAQLKLHGKKMVLDLSDQAIKELLARYLRKDFRTLIFG